MFSSQMDLLNKLNINEKAILFFRKLEVHESDEDDGVQFIIVDDNKNFAEISNEKIVSTYNLTFPITKIEMISVFYSYEPKFKYYIILFYRFIIVLKKLNQQLSFVERINDVKHFYISDYYDSGTPQVVINILGKQEPLVTDFSKNSREHENSSTFESGKKQVLYGLNLSISCQMQSLNVRLREREMQLEEKNRMVSKLLSNCGITDLPSNRQQLITVQENSSATINCESLSVGEPWVRIYLSKWIIGFPINNIQDKTISKFNVFIINNKFIYAEKTLLFLSKLEETLEDCEFKIEYSILGHKSAVLIVVIREPLLTDSNISFSCNVSFIYNTETNINQLYLGEVTITTEDILSNKLAPFRTNKSPFSRDIIAYLSVSLKSVLYLNNQEKKQIFLNVLSEAYGFIPVYTGSSKYIMVNIMQNSVFNGVLISVQMEKQSHRYCIEFYYRQSSQLNLLLQSFQKYHFEADNFLAAARQQPDLNAIHASIKREANAVQSILSGNYKTSPLPSSINCTNILLHRKHNDSLQSLAYLNYFESRTCENLYNSFAVANKHFI